MVYTRTPLEQVDGSKVNQGDVLNLPGLGRHLVSRIDVIELSGKVPPVRYAQLRTLPKDRTKALDIRASSVRLMMLERGRLFTREAR